MNETEKAIDELYAVDPSEFTERRNALAKALKKAGDKDGAAAVTARRKPSQIAYVLNQLARKYPDAVADLVDVGRELAREQRKALRGEASHGLRESIERQRKAIGEIGKKVAALMKELGMDAGAHLQEVTMALQAALVDPAVGAELEKGQLEKAPEAASGFGGEIPTDIAPPRRKTEPPNAEKEEGESAAERKKREHAEAEARKREEEERAYAKAKAEHAKALVEAKATLKEAHAAAKEAHRAAERAAKDAERADAAVEAAEKELANVEASAP